MLGVCTHLGCVLIVEAGDYGGWVSYCICDADFRVLTAFSPLMTLCRSFPINSSALASEYQIELTSYSL